MDISDNSNPSLKRGFAVVEACSNVGSTSIGISQIWDSRHVQVPFAGFQQGAISEKYSDFSDSDDHNAMLPQPNTDMDDC